MWKKSLFKLYFQDKNKYNEIYNQRFYSENSYYLNFKIEGYKAFFFFHKDIINLVMDISTLDKEISQKIYLMPKYTNDLIIKKTLIEEILYTNEIEGIISTRKEITSIIYSLKRNVEIKRKKLISIINKYLLLINNDYIKISSLKDIRTIYDELVYDDIIDEDPKNELDGVLFRRNGVDILNNYSGKVIHEGIVPESNMSNMLEEVIRFLNDSSINPLIRISIFHYVFSYIHPFYDGNGRTNRYISSAYLKQYFNPLSAFILSMAIKDNQKQYYDAFIKTNSKYNKGDITTFVYEFLDIVKKGFENTLDYLTIKCVELNNITNIVNKSNLSKMEKDVLWLLYQNEILSADRLCIKDIANDIKLSEPTIRKILNKLEKENMVKFERRGKYKFYYVIYKL